MSFAAASRRKQSKPQKVGTENDRDDSGILTSANSVSPEPVSIEEQFRNQLLSSLDKSSFFMNEDGHDNPTCMSLAKLKSRRIEEVLEEHSGSKIMVGDKANLLLNGLAHLSQQQLFEFCTASLAGNKDVLKEYENVQRNSSPPDLQSADAEKMIKNKWKEALEKESFKDDKPEVKCPVEECEFKANSTPLVLLHLFDVHKDSEKGGYLNCDTCGGCFKDLLEFRRHRCSSEFSATRPHSTAPSKCETEYEFPRQSESAPTLPNWTADNSFQLRNAEQQLNDLETTTAASSTYDDDNDDNGNNLPEPPLLLNEILGNQSSSNGSNVLDLSAKNVSTSNQIPNLLTNGPFLSSLNTTGIVPQFALSNSFDVPFGSPPMTPIVPSTSLVNDDDWESMMEISNTDENEKIRQLVGDKAAPPTDPNQCLLCRRVLSCKSALQMHYRTHTGERPFKCKICQRAFTTKGNLKTHMGVHRSKHSMRTISGSLQQCPICAKKFLNTAQLSQHMVNHQRPGIPNGSPGNAPFLFPGILGFNSFSNSALPLNLSPRFKEPPKTTPKLEPYDVMFAKKSSNDQQRGSSEDTKEEKMPLTPVVKKESTDVIVNGSNPLKHKLEKEKTSGSNASSTSETSPAKQPKLSNGDKPLLVVADEGYTENTIVNDNPLDAIQKMWKETEPNPPQRQQVTLSKHQCGVCFKHFSSSSALQIHMRTHTGDKPFKCNVCGRAFTTRGNLKVHMGTHSYSQSPSRRGRRIFDFTPELVARQQMLNQISANNVVASAASTPPFGFPMNFSPILAAALAAQQAQAQSCLPLNKESNEKSDDLSNGRNSIESMFWMLRGSNNCLICHKSCNSAQEMEKHLKAHLNGNPTDNNTNAIQLKTE